ncbi:hypothetical protein [Neoroseomonas oryzicola]|uniref:Uncharacterized protein n=1 Tax=Neoroseomonas oryzicola TaxID=535904 RepID=A0A9X9WIQ6_9PROT|nr:hypothetical protein [Neoroseomonas oryzicola]MBR0660216.1 hypothetical protein [Neoroseomonas oryzicola]NKE16709.1 hypothetical protein [Neoroseomonas oryzicola]
MSETQDTQAPEGAPPPADIPASIQGHETDLERGEREHLEITRAVQGMRKTDPAYSAAYKAMMAAGERVAVLKEAAERGATGPNAPATSADAYRISPSDLPPGVNIGDPMVKEAPRIALAHGFTPNEFRAGVADLPYLARVEQRGGNPIVEGMKQLCLIVGGPEKAKEVSETARQYVAKHPDLAAFLDATGLGNSARMITIIYERARAGR